MTCHTTWFCTIDRIMLLIKRTSSHMMSAPQGTPKEVPPSSLIVNEQLLNKHEGVFIAELWQWPPKAEQQSVGEGGSMWGKEVGGWICVRERDKTEQRDTATSWKEVTPVSQSRRVAVEKKNKDRANRGSEFREKEEISAGSLSPCLSGWRENLHGVISSTMGCSLCTLQKPEEHYKLLYEVCQVLWPRPFKTPEEFARLFFEGVVFW